MKPTALLAVVLRRSFVESRRRMGNYHAMPAVFTAGEKMLLTGEIYVYGLMDLSPKM